ncbi:MAG TPA: nitric-oxide reductase large subunit [Gammaproteobacteria bacterium]|nr:nitric-oxide reductase large subunit [Gammaproteobacteria bacterium]
MTTYSSHFSIRRLWWILGVSMLVMFGTLLYFGGLIYQVAPPIPAAVRSESGATLFTREQIERGQNVWQSLGGMEQGSIWGHGSYVAPDWSADWLHREALALLDRLATREQASSYAQLPPPDQARLRALLREAMRTNTVDARSGVVTVTDDRASAIGTVAAHYSDLFRALTPQGRALRERYAFPIDATLTPEESAALNAFFFWTAWASVTRRPGDSVSYTSNWPHEPLVGNEPTGAVFLWTFVSIIVLLASIGALVWYYAREFDVWRRDAEPESGFARADFMATTAVTPSMRATSAFFIVVALLFLAQVLLGIITAHYAVEGQGLYGLPLSAWFPYSVTRTWHTQLAVLWIATAWLGTGLYVAPLLGGREPRLQTAGVWFLLASLVVIVAGSFTGEWLAINRKITDAVSNFWLGHQGYEYVDLGRFWQIYLFIGLLLWVVLVLRGLWPALRDRSNRSLPSLVVVATLAIGLLFGAGLLYGRNTNISIMEYWRWWVVHLWVEGVFEVFATAIVSALLVRMGLVRASVATTSVLVSTIIFLGGGVLGTFHHLYWSGTPIGVIALGSVFSALEVVPLLVVGFEAYSRASHEDLFDWQRPYHWPFKFFASVLVWNLVGAGVFGFLINPPLALYYMQGLNTTPTHGHAALFGVYGMLGLGLMLFCMRGLTDPTRWSNRLLATSFWCLNIGLAMMVFLSLLPQGLYQAFASFTRDYAYARSAEVIHGPVMQALVWARVPGDVVFAVGAGAFVAFVARAFLSRRAGHEPERAASATIALADSPQTPDL